MENLSDDKDINRAWENIKENKHHISCILLVSLSSPHIKENIKTSAKESLGMHELKQHKPWFDEECLGFLDQRKQVKMQWIQDPSQITVDNLNNVRCDANRHFRNKKEE